jgi:hypothetical protein
VLILYLDGYYFVSVSIIVEENREHLYARFREQVQQ